jgi:hypothetical protein
MLIGASVSFSEMLHRFFGSICIPPNTRQILSTTKTSIMPIFKIPFTSNFLCIRYLGKLCVCGGISCMNQELKHTYKLSFETIYHNFHNYLWRWTG